MTASIEISIIVPVYNTSAYLDKCLTSLVNQTFDNYEIIVVNDGSTDNSLAILADWQQRYPDKLKLIDKPNGGLSDARNAGIIDATGEYVIFVDSDDYLSVDALTVMHQQVKLHQADICYCDLEVVNESGAQLQILDSGGDANKAIDPKENPQVIATLLPSACNKLIASDLFDGQVAPFDKGIWYEDVATIPLLLAQANLVVKVNKPLYKYVRRDGSITSQYSPKVLDGLQAISNLEQKFINARLADAFNEGLLLIKLKMLSATTIRICQSFNSATVSRDIPPVRDYYLSLLKSESNVDHSTIGKLQRFILWMLKRNLSSLLMRVYQCKAAIANRGRA